MKPLSREYYDESLDLLTEYIKTYKLDKQITNSCIQLLKGVYTNNLLLPVQISFRNHIVLTWVYDCRILQIFLYPVIEYLTQDNDTLLNNYDNSYETGNIVYNKEDKINKLINWLKKGSNYKDLYNYSCAYNKLDKDKVINHGY